MEKFKLTKENIVMLFAGAALTFSLMNCTNTLKENEITPKQPEEISFQDDIAPVEPIEQTSIIPEENIVEPIGQPDIISEENIVENPDTVNIDSDKVINDYLIDLQNGFNELKNYASDKWNSEEFQTKLSICKEKLKMLLDFVFNGKEINGITFKQLSTEAKKNVMQSLIELDEWIETLFPEYKERIYDWLVNLGVGGVELWNDLKDGFNSYTQDVMETYNSQNSASHIKLK